MVIGMQVLKLLQQWKEEIIKNKNILHMEITSQANLFMSFGMRVFQKC